MNTRLFLAILFSATAACAQDNGAFDSSIYLPDDTAIAKAAAACGPDQIKFDVTHPERPQPPVAVEPGKALVYVVEDAGYCGDYCVPTVKVGLDGAWMGANQGSSYFSFPVAPGEHHLCARWQSIFSSRSQVAALAHFTAETGKTYYFRVRAVDAQHFGFLLDLDPIDPDQGRLLVALYPLSIFRAKGRQASRSKSKSQTGSHGSPAH